MKRVTLFIGVFFLLFSCSDRDYNVLSSTKEDDTHGEESPIVTRATSRPITKYVEGYYRNSPVNKIFIHTPKGKYDESTMPKFQINFKSNTTDGVSEILNMGREILAVYLEIGIEDNPNDWDRSTWTVNVKNSPHFTWPSVWRFDGYWERSMTCYYMDKSDKLYIDLPGGISQDHYINTEGYRNYRKAGKSWSGNHLTRKYREDFGRGGVKQKSIKLSDSHVAYMRNNRDFKFNIYSAVCKYVDLFQHTSAPTSKKNQWIAINSSIGNGYFADCYLTKVRLKFVLAPK